MSQIREISAAWNALLDESGCNRALGCAEWYIGNCRARSLTPYVIAAVKDERTSGILPLTIDPPSGTLAFPAFVSDYNDALVYGDDPQLTADMLRYVLLQMGTKKIVLSRVRADSTCIKAIPFLERDAHIRCLYREIDTYLYVDLPGTFDDYLASRSRTFRKSIKRAQRKFEATGFAIRELEPSSFDPYKLPDLFLSLVSARHKENCSITRNPRTTTFVREVVPTAFSTGKLRAFAIFDGDRIIALDMCLVGADGLGAWQGGFLDEAEDWSPGMVLFAHGIREAINTRLKEYDFLKGDEEYKRHWANNSRAICEMEIVTNR